MIKLRVEWRHDCPSCGTQVVVDFINEPNRACVCPWCGLVDECGPSRVGDELRQYLLNAIRQIEDTVNDRTPVPS